MAVTIDAKDLAFNPTIRVENALGTKRLLVFLAKAILTNVAVGTVAVAITQEVAHAIDAALVDSAITIELAIDLGAGRRIALFLAHPIDALKAFQAGVAFVAFRQNGCLTGAVILANLPGLTIAIAVAGWAA